MLDYLSLLIGCISAIIAGVALYFQAHQNKKRISYIHLHKNLNNPNKHHPDLKLFYRGVVAENVVIHDLAFFNDGKEAVIREDLIEKIKLRFPGSCKVLSAEIGYKNNENSKINIHKQSNENEVFLSLNYLNRGDGFILKIIADSKESDIQVSGGVLNGVLDKYDVSLLKKMYPAYNSIFWLLITAIVGYIVHLIVGFLTSGLSISSDVKSVINVIAVITSILFIPSYIQATYGGIWEKILSAPFISTYGSKTPFAFKPIVTIVSSIYMV